MQMQEHVLNFKIANQNQGEVYIDIAKAMSIVNRKLYRQQGLWHVHGVCTYADAQDATDPLKTIGIPYTVSISGAPRNWVTRNALVKALSLWQDQQKQAYDNVSPSIKPKWNDFKVWLNENHRTTGDLIPISGHMFGGTDLYNAGMWVQSKIVYEQADAAGAVIQYEPELHILGPNNGTTNLGLIFQYQDSRASVFSPDPNVLVGVDETMYTLASEVLGNQTDEIVENMQTDNNEPPYDQDEYPGGSTNGNEPVLYSFGANSSTGKRKLTLNGFAAPNGLIEIQFDKTTGTQAVENTGEFWIQLFVSHREAY
mgnify:CR=1 FL=1